MQPSLFNMPQNLLPQHGEAYLYNHFFTPTRSDDFFNALSKTIQWKQEPIKMFGKEVMQPRLTAWYGEKNAAYTYSGITMQPVPWTKELLNIKEKIEPVAHVRFNSALLNFYRYGTDSMGWHRDNEKELGKNPVIASVSFGADRLFKMRLYKDKTEVKNIVLSNGSLLIMAGETQHYWEHALPKTSKPTGARINITFRVIL